MSREAVEKAVRDHAPEWWAIGDVQAVVRSVCDDATVADREDIANEMWAMGAGAQHDGCRYGGDEPADADYQNECDTCQAWLLAAAGEILTAKATDRENGSAER